MNVSKRFALLLIPVVLVVPACHPHHAEHAHAEHHTIVVTSPQQRDVTVTQQYVGQIHSRRHVELCAIEPGYLEAITAKEGQMVKAGDILFSVVPTLYKARLEAEVAEARLAQLEVNNTQRLVEQNVVSANELALMQAKLAKAEAKVKLAEAELNFTTVRAPFDGMMDRLYEQQGSLVKEGDVLTTLSDNSSMWVYFNVPESPYMDYIAGGRENQAQQIDLVLANGKRFPHSGVIGAIEAKFNNETGNIPFRADFPNPERSLRHGQTGNVLINRTIKGALVIPQRATFEILDKRYVFLVGADGLVNQQEVTIVHEQDDIFLIGKGLTVTDRVVLEGVRQVKDGEKIEFEYRKPEDALAHQKNHAE